MKWIYQKKRYYEFTELKYLHVKLFLNSFFKTLTEDDFKSSPIYLLKRSIPHRQTDLLLYYDHVSLRTKERNSRSLRLAATMPHTLKTPLFLRPDSIKTVGCWSDCVSK